MSQFEIILGAWIAFHGQLGVDVKASFAPAASEAQIQSVETKIGFRLPDDLRALYKIANGQFNPYEHEDELSKKLAIEEKWAPLFGYYEFMPLQQALNEYEFQLDMYTQEMEFNQKYNKANPDKAIKPIAWDTRAGDPVDPAGWNPMWFPFAKSNADSYSVDLSPIQGGTTGQVIEHGADVVRLSVVAPSVSDLLEAGATKLDANEKHRYQISPFEGHYRGTVYFDMDWRNKPQNIESRLNLKGAISALVFTWQHRYQTTLDKRDQKFSVWLDQQGIAKDDIAEVRHFVHYQLSTETIGFGGSSNLLKSLVIKITNWAASLFLTPAGYETEGNTYYMSLASAVLKSKSDAHAHISSTIGNGLLIQDAITLFHRYQLDVGAWSQNEYEIAEALRSEFSKVNLVGDDGAFGYSMKMTGQVLEICQSSFDPDSYKSEDHCDEINIAAFLQ